MNKTTNAGGRSMWLGSQKGGQGDYRPGEGGIKVMPRTIQQTAPKE